MDDRETAKVPRRVATDSPLRQPSKDFAAWHYAIQPDLANGIDRHREFPLCKIRSPVFLLGDGRDLPSTISPVHNPHECDDGGMEHGAVRDRELVRTYSGNKRMENVWKGLESTGENAEEQGRGPPDWRRGLEGIEYRDSSRQLEDVHVNVTGRVIGVPCRGDWLADPVLLLFPSYL